MNKTKALLFFPLLLCLSCNDSNEDDSLLPLSESSKELNQEKHEINFKALYSKHHTIPQNEAEQMAIAFGNMSSKNGQSLKSATKSPIKDVKVVATGKGLKSTTNAVDTLAYIVNFANEEGFALIAADDRVSNPILAYTESGNYDEDYINKNIPALAGMIEDSYNYVKYEIAKFEEEKDSLLTVADSILKSGRYPKVDNQLKTIYTGTAYLYVSEYESPTLLSTTWGQGSPYNDSVGYCSTHPANNNVAGCMATAVAQVMAYWKYPQTMYGHTFDWVGMTSDKYGSNVSVEDQKSIAYLFKLIGVYNQMRYKCYIEGSGSYWSNTKPWLQYVLGYNIIDGDYNWYDVWQYLRVGAPVIITAKDPYVNKAHAWVLDGYQSVNYIANTYVVDSETGAYVITSSTPTVECYIHNNWGWDGTGNGYFLADCFFTMYPRDGSYDDEPATLNRFYTDNKEIHVLYH